MTTLRILAGLVAAAAVATEASLPNSIASRIVVRKVAIIGGGASGSHAALRLKEDFGHSVVVIEKENHLVCCAPSGSSGAPESSC
jgi:heterodisulfide reductase subunit A-like polyferredoxin